jgi:polar amino acid transport system substrate-binding protein
MKTWQEDLLKAAEHAACEASLFEKVVPVAACPGFEHCACGMRLPLPVSNPRTVLLNNYPRRWCERYEAANYIAVEATVQHARRTQAPLVWNDTVFESTPALWDEAQSHGLQVGWALSARDASGAAAAQGGISRLARGAAHSGGRPSAGVHPHRNGRGGRGRRDRVMTPAPLNTAQRIVRRGHLRAGVSKGIYGLSYRDEKLHCWRGFDVELARAVAAAVLGDADAVEFLPVAPEERCATVAEGLVDIGTFNASATLGREAEHDVLFPQAMLYDGEAFLVRASEFEGRDSTSGIAALSQRIVAVQQGATTTANLVHHFGQRQLSYELRPFATPQQALAAYASGVCNVYALDRIPLSGERLRLPAPEQHLILDEQVSKEAMGPVVSAADSAWSRAVTWVMRVLIEGEELGLTSLNCGRHVDIGEIHVRTFLHPSPHVLQRLGLQPGFPLLVLRQVGNYAEVFARTLGHASPLHLPRLKNTLWSQGGLLISPSFH